MAIKRPQEFVYVSPDGKTERTYNEHAASVLVPSWKRKAKAKAKAKAAPAPKPVTEESADDGSGGSSEPAGSDGG
jgi:hypothetical protein